MVCTSSPQSGQTDHHLAECSGLYHSHSVHAPNFLNFVLVLVFVFTFHHSDIQKWFKLYEVISKAGLRVIKTHSIPSEARNVLNIQNKKAIAFDLIIVCRVQLPESVSQISLEKFKSNIKFHYKKRLNQLADANIKIYGLDWLSIFFGVLLEQKFEFVVKTSTEQNISIQEAFEVCRDIVNTD